MPWSLYVDGNQKYNLIIYPARICSSCWTPMQEWMMRIMRICEYESVWKWIGKFQSSQLRIHIFKLNPILRPPLNSSTTTCDQTLLKSLHLFRSPTVSKTITFKEPIFVSSLLFQNPRRYHISSHFQLTELWPASWIWLFDGYLSRWSHSKMPKLLRPLSPDSRSYPLNWDWESGYLLSPVHEQLAFRV